MEGDSHHVRVHEVFEGYRDRPLADLLLTANHVIAETVTLLRMKGHPDPKLWPLVLGEAREEAPSPGVPDLS